MSFPMLPGDLDESQRLWRNTVAPQNPFMWDRETEERNAERLRQLRQLQGTPNAPLEIDGNGPRRPQGPVQQALSATGQSPPAMDFLMGEAQRQAQMPTTTEWQTHTAPITIMENMTDRYGRFLGTRSTQATGDSYTAPVTRPNPAYNASLHALGQGMQAQSHVDAARVQFQGQQQTRAEDRRDRLVTHMAEGIMRANPNMPSEMAMRRAQEGFAQLNPEERSGLNREAGTTGAATPGRAPQQSFLADTLFNVTGGTRAADATKRNEQLQNFILALESNQRGGRDWIAQNAEQVVPFLQSEFTNEFPNFWTQNTWNLGMPQSQAERAREVIAQALTRRLGNQAPTLHRDIISQQMGRITPQMLETLRANPVSAAPPAAPMNVAPYRVDPYSPIGVFTNAADFLMNPVGVVERNRRR